MIEPDIARGAVVDTTRAEEDGINRSGALAIAELMTHERISVVDAVREVKLARGVVLQNQSFQCQLVQMARREGLLGDRPEAEPAAEAKKTK